MSAPTPYLTLLGAVWEGERLRVPFGRAVLGRPGFVHGGAIGGLLEAVARRAAGEDASLVTITVEYLRPGPEADTWFDARVTRRGARLVQVAAQAWQGDEARPLALARLTYRRE